VPIGPVNEFREESTRTDFTGPWQGATTEIVVDRFAGPWQSVVAEILPPDAAGPWQSAVAETVPSEFVGAWQAGTTETETDQFNGPWQADLYNAEIPPMADLIPVGYDQSTGESRPQTDTDQLVTELGNSSQARASYGELYVTAPAGTTVVAGVPTKILGTTALGALTQDFDMPANNRLRYTGTAAQKFMVQATISFTMGTPPNDVLPQLADQLGVQAASVIQQHVPDVNQWNAVVQGIFNLATNDYVEAFVDVGVSDTATAQKLVLTARPIQ
jgi:hypothetical protein